MKTLLCLIFLLSGSQWAFGDTEGSLFGYSVETADKKHIFVMSEVRGPRVPPLEKRDLYPISGMYLNDGSAIPLWSVDWRSYVYLPGGGRYIVRRGRSVQTSGTYQEEVFSFIDAGRLLRTYRAKDLVDFPWLLPHYSHHYGVVTGCLSGDGDKGDGVALSVGGSEYANNDGVTFDNDRQTMEITTYTGERFLFDLKTGDTISASHPARLIALAMFALLLIAYFIYRFLTARRFPARSRLQLSNVIVGEVFTFSLILIPAVAIGFTRVQGRCDDYLLTLFERLWISTYLFPIYCTNLILNASPQPDDNLLMYVSSPEGQAWIVGFWLSCVLIITIADRFYVGLLGRFVVREKPIIDSSGPE